MTEGATPLSAAAVAGHVPIIAALVTAGADTETKTEHQHTPLYRAIMKGHAEAVKALLAGKANLETGNKVSRVGWGENCGWVEAGLEGEVGCWQRDM
ncbi:hypothetical protein T484DRAFT_1785813 [Baffinella frigidus]|nr:hypothetical protein T484DRAFT_1785813 [Cryptophyta sp. CCMP2293]